MSYLGGIGFGGMYGLLHGLRHSPSRRFKVRMNSVLNGAGKYGSRAGNGLGIIAMLYTSFECLADRFEVESYVGGSDMVNPVLAAAATGIFYKSTAGLRVAALAGVLGAGACGGIYLADNVLRGGSRGGLLL